MNLKSVLRASVALTAALAAPLLAAQWRVQYFYDEEKSTFAINDIRFASPRRGVAVGAIVEGKSIRPMSAVTADGGTHWVVEPLREAGTSLFFLNENAGWMVTAKGLWHTAEAGRSWTKLPKAPNGILRVCFVDEQHGWAVGIKNGVYETNDGGTRWKPVPAAGEVKANPEYTAYTVVQFLTPSDGIIIGYNLPPRRDEPGPPDWLDPEKLARRAEWPHLSIQLETHNGGKTWNTSTASLFGRITRVSFAGPLGFGLGLIEFSASFMYPSEVMWINSRTGKSDRVYREKTRAITDVFITPGGTGYLAGVEVPGRVRLAVPSKLKILTSTDLKNWKEMETDYRAVGARATFAHAGDDLWVALDSGMILKLAK